MRHSARRVTGGAGLTPLQSRPNLGVRRVREQADRLLGPEIADVDGNREEPRGTISVFNGPPPEIRTFESEAEESSAVGAWLSVLSADGMLPHEFGVFVRSGEQVVRATAAVQAAGLTPRVLDERVEMRQGEVNVATMHLAKGLEFRARRRDGV